MLKTLAMGAAGALVLMTSNAVADGLPMRAAKAAACCEQPNWTGFYIGVGVGGAFTTNQHSAKETDTYYDSTSVYKLWDLDNGRSHAFGTVTAGYDQLFRSRWLAGVFVDYDFGNGNNHSSILGGTPYAYDLRLSDESKHAWSIGGRLGFLSSPSTLLYLSTGWTQVSSDGKASFYSDYDGYHKLSFNNDRDGWFVGAGIETQLGWLRDGWSLRGEYRFTRLNDDHKSLSLYEGAPECEYCLVSQRLAFDRDTDVHSLRAVLSYKFGRREEAAPLK
jgi:outer membrane immunogenic protein